MNHKCCDCSYDSLFVKEVIRTYCGDSTVEGPIEVPNPGPEMPPNPGPEMPPNPIECIASTLSIPVYPVELGVLPVFRYLNVSKNDGPVDWMEFDESNSDINPSEQMQNLANYLFTAEDGQSVAFVDSTSFGEPPTLDTSTGLLDLPVSGLSGNNVTLAGLSYDLYQTGLGIGGRQFEVVDLVNETTTIKVFPMPDASPEEDGYVVMGGNGIDPLIFTSCSKAILQLKEEEEDLIANCTVSVEENSGYEDGGDFELKVDGNRMGYLRDVIHNPEMPFYVDIFSDYIQFQAKEDNIVSISLTPLGDQLNYSTRFTEGSGLIEPNTGIFNFKLNKSSSCDIPIRCSPDEYTIEVPKESEVTIKNIYYRHDGELKQESIEIGNSNTILKFFLGRDLPGNSNLYEKMGCLVLTCSKTYYGDIKFSFFGLDSEGYYEESSIEGVDTLLEIHPYLTRSEVTVDVTSSIIEIIPASEAGVPNDENDIYPLLDTTIFNSCAQLTISKPDGDGDGTGSGDCAKSYTYVLRLGLGGPFEVNHVCEVGDEQASGIVRKLHNVCARIAFQNATVENRLKSTHLITYKNEDNGTSYIVNELTRNIDSSEVGVHADMLLAGASYVEQYNYRDYYIEFKATYADGSKVGKGGIKIRTTTDGTPIPTDDLPACQVPD